MEKRILACILLLALVFAPVAFAATEDVWDMAKSDAYGKKAGGMLGRGLVNASTCFVDVLVQTVDGTKKGPPLLGSLTGLGGGIGCTALRAISGVLDVGTFWVPGFNGIPVAKSYSNCLCEEEVVQQAPEAVVAPAPVVAAPMPVAPVTVTQPVAPVEKKHDPYEYVKK